MLLLPTTLVKPEEAMNLHEIFEAPTAASHEKRKKFMDSTQKDPNLKARFLSMFDEGMQLGIFGMTIKICMVIYRKLPYTMVDLIK